LYYSGNAGRKKKTFSIVSTSYVIVPGDLFLIFCSDFTVDASACPGMIYDAHTEDPSRVKAAIFYSITSTQKGLQVCKKIKYFMFNLDVHFLDLI
jgi:hypothetical protein